jgi:type I restriction enzyme, S subunit
MWQINCQHVYAQASCDLIGSAAPHVNVERIKNFWLLIPPRPEQDAIVAWLVEETTRIDEAIERARTEISLAREYRVRVIADVVTGKLDVREVSIELPNETSELAGAQWTDAVEESGDADVDSDDFIGDEEIG